MADSFFHSYLYNLLPKYFKQANYNDVNDEPLLQRYLRNFEDELDENFYPFIKNLLEIVDPSYTELKFLKLVGQGLGDPPAFASDEDFYRKIIRYAVEIYKVKGTKLSYQMLFNFKGYKIDIVEDTPIRSVNYDQPDIEYDVPNGDTGDFLYHYDQDCDHCSGYQIIFLNTNDGDIGSKVLEAFQSIIPFVEPINATFMGFGYEGVIPTCEEIQNYSKTYNANRKEINFSMDFPSSGTIVYSMTGILKETNEVVILKDNVEFFNADDLEAELSRVRLNLLIDVEDYLSVQYTFKHHCTDGSFSNGIIDTIPLVVLGTYALQTELTKITTPTGDLDRKLQFNQSPLRTAPIQNVSPPVFAVGDVFTGSNGDDIKENDLNLIKFSVLKSQFNVVSAMFVDRYDNVIYPEIADDDDDSTYTMIRLQGVLGSGQEGGEMFYNYLYVAEDNRYADPSTIQYGGIQYNAKLNNPPLGPGWEGSSYITVSYKTNDVLYPPPGGGFYSLHATGSSPEVFDSLSTFTPGGAGAVLGNNKVQILFSKEIGYVPVSARYTDINGDVFTTNTITEDDTYWIVTFESVLIFTSINGQNNIFDISDTDEYAPVTPGSGNINAIYHRQLSSGTAYVKQDTNAEALGSTVGNIPDGSSFDTTYHNQTANAIYYRFYASFGYVPVAAKFKVTSGGTFANVEPTDENDPDLGPAKLFTFSGLNLTGFKDVFLEFYDVNPAPACPIPTGLEIHDNGDGTIGASWNLVSPGINVGWRIININDDQNNLDSGAGTNMTYNYGGIAGTYRVIVETICNFSGSTVISPSASIEITVGDKMLIGALISPQENALVVAPQYVQLKALRAAITLYQPNTLTNNIFRNYSDAGYQVILNLNSKALDGSPFQNMDDETINDAYRAAVVQFLDTRVVGYNVYAIAVENEETNFTYHGSSSDNVTNYQQMLHIVIEEAHARGIKVMNGGYTGPAFKWIVWDYLLNIAGDETRANEFRAAEFQSSQIVTNWLSSPTWAPRIANIRNHFNYILNTSPDADFLNFHWYSPTNDDVLNGSIRQQSLIDTAEALRYLTGMQNISTNEIGMNNSGSTGPTQLINACIAAGIKVFIYYDGEKSDGSRVDGVDAYALHNDPANTLRPAGQEFRNKLIDYYS